MRKLAKMAILAIAMLLIMIIMPVAMNNERIALGAAPQQEMAAAECIDPPSGLVSWWPGDLNAFDVIRRNHGALGGDTTFAPGLVRDAFSFDGFADWVHAPGDGIDHLQEFSMECWVRHDSPLPEKNRYVSLGYDKAILRYEDGTLQFLMSFLEEVHTYGPTDLKVPDGDYNPFTIQPIEPDQFSFVHIRGLKPNEHISISAKFTNGDSDFMCWPSEQLELERSYENNILGAQMVTGANPEVGRVRYPSSGHLVVGCFNYDRANQGTWTLTVETFTLEKIEVGYSWDDGEFHHVAGTYDGVSMRLYMDGCQVVELSVSGSVITGNGVEIGSEEEGFHGLVDEVSVYDRALSDEEILAIYSAGSDGKCKPEDEYFWYSAYYPDSTYVSGVGGYVDNGDPDVLGDEHQYLYFIGDMTGYKVEVTLTDYAEEHPEGDTSPGWIEPHQHPYNPYAPGPVEPRHFEEVSHVYLRFEGEDYTEDYTDGARLHSDEFHVDERGIFLGAWPYGIYRWDHNWNDPDFNGEMNYPAVQIAPAPPVPPDPTRITRTETLAYNPDDNVWYAGRRCLGWEYRDVYELVDTDGDESFLDEEWTVAFSYPALDPTNPSEHHDGLEYAGGYLWISDMFSDRIAQWYCDNGVWIEMDVFEYTTAASVEGMGFGPNDHFWASSFLPEYGQEPHIYEFGGGVLQKEFPSISVNVDIKPGSWPNPINIKSAGVLPVAICGTEELDVMTIDPGTITMRISDAEEEVYPLRWSYEDVATPFVGDPGEGHALDGDGYTDLVLHFDMREVVDTLGLNDHLFETIPLIITVNPYEYGERIVGTDHVWILAPKRPGRIRYTGNWMIQSGDCLKPQAMRRGCQVRARKLD